VKLAEAFGIRAAAVTTRAEVMSTVQAARSHKGPFLINFMVEQEDTVYPMIVPGAALHEMIRRPKANPLIER
jgi:acetolactate synthase-1/2/3 large subunit